LMPWEYGPMAGGASGELMTVRLLIPYA